MNTQSTNRIVAVLFSVLFPGSGQFSNGQWLKGLIAVVLLIVSVYVPVVMFEEIPYPLLLVWVWSVWDAYRVAKKRDQRGEPVRWVLLVLGGFLSLVSIAGSIVVLVAFAVFSFFSIGGGQDEVKEMAAQRLEEQYHEPFTVNSVDYSWNAGKYFLDATPEKHPDLRINVSVSDDHSIWTDDYFSKVWSQAAEQRLQPVASQIFGGGHLVYANINGQEAFREELNAKREVLSYQDMVNDHPDQLTQDVRVYLLGAYKSEREQQTLEQTLKLIQSFPEAERQHLDISVCWYDPAVQEKLKEQSGEEMYQYLLHNVNPRPLFELTIWDGRVPGIKTVDDLKSYVRN